MQLPNKLYSYKQSTLALVPVLLHEIKKGPLSAESLYDRVRSTLKDPTDFLSVMDCLYALRAIEMNDDGEVYICL